MARPSVGFDLHWLRSLTLKPRLIWCLQRRACHLSWNFNKENGPPFPGSGSFRVIWPLHFTENRPPPGPEALTHNLTSLSQPQTFLPTWCLELVCVCVCVCVCMHTCTQVCVLLSQMGSGANWLYPLSLNMILLVLICSYPYSEN